jgi:adenylate cyclase
LAGRATANSHSGGDVAGYSRLMGGDEVGTLAQLTASRAAMDRVIAVHRGRIVNSVGDSVLAEFSSIVDAVEALVAGVGMAEHA